MKYYEINDADTDSAWLVKDVRLPSGAEVFGDEFESGTVWKRSNDLVGAWDGIGVPVGLSKAIDDIPIVSSAVRYVIERFVGDDVQFIPIYIPRIRDTWFVMNALRIIACVNVGASEFTLEKGASATSSGPFRTMARLRIDASSVDRCHLFRPRGWEVALIFSERLRDAVVEVCGTTVAYDAVT